MPIRGPLTHIDLSVSDPARAIPFYGALFEALGYRRAAYDLPGFREPGATRATWYVRIAEQAFFGIEVRPSSGENRERPVDRYSPGLHHMAFHAESAADVDRVHEAMTAAGATVLDAPADYSGDPAYTDGYYAAFYADPDGLKVEVAHIPPQNR